MRHSSYVPKLANQYLVALATQRWQLSVPWGIGGVVGVGPIAGHGPPVCSGLLILFRKTNRLIFHERVRPTKILSDDWLAAPELPQKLPAFRLPARV